MTPEQFLEFARVLPEPMLLVTGQGEILATNRPTATLMGCSSKELQGKKLFDLVTEPPEKVLTYLQSCSRSRQLVIGSLSFLLPDGQHALCRSEGAVVQPSSTESPALNLLRLENRAKASGEFVLLNQKIGELTKENHRRQQTEAALIRKNKELQQAIRQLKTTQLQLVQTEKMSSLGQLVAGVAHEINNPVNFIHGNLVHANEYIQDLVELVEIYQQEYPHPNPTIQEKIEDIDLDFLTQDLHKLLQSMRLGTNRIREIVKSLRNFSRLDEAEAKEVDIHEGIESTLVILQNRLKARPEHPGIQILKDYGNLPLVDCYPGQLNQVFMNIISNAIDALEMPQTWKVRNSEISQPSNLSTCKSANPTIWISTEKRGSDRIAIRIADNGPGIPKKICQQIFDPFFTTKPVGKGTGLGLSISYQIVTETHQGQLFCLSEPGQGTEFIIEIPVHQHVSEPLEMSITLT